MQQLGGGFGAGKQEWLWVIAIAPDPALEMPSLPHINALFLSGHWTLPRSVMEESKSSSSVPGAAFGYLRSFCLKSPQHSGGGNFPQRPGISPSPDPYLPLWAGAGTGDSARTHGRSWSLGTPSTLDCTVLINSPYSWQ